MSVKKALEGIIESMWEDWNNGANGDVWIGHAKSLQAIVDVMGNDDYVYRQKEEERPSA